MPAAAQNRIADFSKLSYSDVALILKLRDDGHAQTAIADKVGCSQSTVSRCLQEFTSTIQLAKLKTHNRALELTEAALDGSVKAAKDGKPEAALEVLDRLDVAPKRRDEHHSTQVMVVVQTQSVIPGIQTLSPTTFASNALQQGAGSD